MILANTFDYIKRLEQAGCSHQAAEAQIEVLTALSQEISMQSVTKAELDNVEKSLRQQIEKTEIRLEHKIEQVESRLDHKIDKLDVRLSHVEKRVETLSANMKWAVGISLTYLTVFITFVQFLKH